MSRALVPEVVVPAARRGALAKAAGRVTPFLGAMEAVATLGQEVRACIELRERARTERAAIAARRDVAMAAIAAWQEATRTQLQQAARERDELRACLLPIVTRAAEVGDLDTMRTALDALQRVLETPVLQGVGPVPAVGTAE